MFDNKFASKISICHNINNKKAYLFFHKDNNKADIGYKANADDFDN